MKYKAIIFDLDGVICHTDHYHYQAWKKIADKLNIYFDEKINNRLRGVSRMESFDIILENYEKVLNQEEKQNYANEKNEIYKELLEKISEKDLSNQVKETLVQLKEKGIKIAIGSSSKNAVFILKQLDIYHIFDGISDGNNISKTKPDPEVFLKAAKYIEEEPKDCLVVEDAIAGLIAAKKGGMDSASIGDANQSDLANYKLTKFSDLMKIIE